MKAYQQMRDSHKRTHASAHAGLNVRWHAHADECTHVRTHARSVHAWASRHANAYARVRARTGKHASRPAL
eukprot:6187528-Pleurochrysis_carterae.AAC.2